jgi:hypothetical protein
VSAIPDWAQTLEPKDPVLPQVASVEQSPDDPYELMIFEGSVFPRGATERIRAYGWEEYSDWLTGRYFARSDQIFLANCLLGLNLRERPHRALCNFMVHKNPGVELGLLDPTCRKRILLAPRGTGKTHFVRAEITQWLLNYPNIRIVFLSGGENVAVPQLEAIKKGFSHPTAAMQRFFPEYVMVSLWTKKKKQFEDVLISDWGTMHHFTLSNRTNTTLPEASFTLATQESVSSGNLTEAGAPAYGEPGAPAQPSTVVPAGQPVAAQPPMKHEVLARMVTGLADALAGFSAGIASKGKVSGAEVVQNLEGQRAEQQQKATAAAQAQKNAELQNQLTTGAINEMNVKNHTGDLEANVTRAQWNVDHLFDSAVKSGMPQETADLARTQFRTGHPSVACCTWTYQTRLLFHNWIRRNGVENVRTAPRSTFRESPRLSSVKIIVGHQNSCPRERASVA